MRARALLEAETWCCDHRVDQIHHQERSGGTRINCCALPCEGVHNQCRPIRSLHVSVLQPFLATRPRCSSCTAAGHRASHTVPARLFAAPVQLCRTAHSDARPRGAARLLPAPTRTPCPLRLGGLFRVVCVRLWRRAWRNLGCLFNHFCVLWRRLRCLRRLRALCRLTQLL